ncbi:hypothetical protein EAM01S_16_01000 [Erwinia amylovora NBRC 12687 = CFBP 1232]|nr:hypothetical protein EAM01S_16_01000 [Erwinia amylovora NBRC 12687 = CFBP 1232]
MPDMVTVEGKIVRGHKITCKPKIKKLVYKYNRAVQTIDRFFGASNGNTLDSFTGAGAV